MTVILDNYTVDQVGWINLNVQVTFELRVSAETAQQTAQRWLHTHSLHLHAAAPTLVVSKQPHWRVPVTLCLPQQPVLDVMLLDVDAHGGVIVDRESAEKQLLNRLNQQVQPQLNTTPFIPQSLPSTYHTQLQPKPYFTTG